MAETLTLTLKNGTKIALPDVKTVNDVIAQFEKDLHDLRLLKKTLERFSEKKEAPGGD